jgi:hypothetical protein
MKAKGQLPNKLFGGNDDYNSHHIHLKDRGSYIEVEDTITLC